MSGVEVKNMFPPLRRIRQQIVGWRKEESVASVEHGEVFQVIVGIADQRIEDHLTEKHWDINLWLATVLAHQGEKVCVAQVVPAFRPKQGLGAYHVEAAPDICHVKPAHQQYLAFAAGNHSRFRNIYACGFCEIHCGRFDGHHGQGVSCAGEFGDP